MIFEKLRLSLIFPYQTTFCMKQTFLVFTILLATTTIFATILPDSAQGETKDSTKLILFDIPIAAQIDSAILCYYEELSDITHDVNSLSDLRLDDSLPVFNSEYYIQKLQDLNKTTPFDLSYNSTIEAFIHLYVSRRRELSSRCLGRAEQYFPLFEETLDKYNLPLELKYLAVVESALDAQARSRAGAVGLWQFMYGTGKNFGLTIDSYVDERNDPRASTEAACKYLSYLHKMFGDWNLALAAYNCGEGRVAKAIRRSGGKKNYWEIYPYLPSETRGYVPAFIAVNYLFAHANDHQIVATPSAYKAYEIDSIHIENKMTFSEIAELLDVQESIIEDLNPIYRLKTIPAYKHFNVVYLPKEKANIWVANLDTITAIISKKPEVITEPVVIEAPKNELYYTVRSGDYLGKIASRNGVSVRQIQQWNNLNGTNLRVGQKLVIYSNGNTPKPAVTASSTTNSGTNQYYTIKSGDTLWNIAKARGVSVDDLKKWNSHLNINNIKPGLKIVVGKA
jgi:membrane-bound lytic murein transglycosylase D